MGKCVLSTTNDFFLQLEIIAIRACPEMEHLLVLVPNEEEQEKEDDITFSKLKRPELYKVPKLRSMICSSSRGIESTQFPLLAEMVIGGCKKLKCLVASGDDDHCQDDEDDSLHLFCNPKVSFPSLRRLFLMEHTESKNVWCDKVPMGFFRGLVELRIFQYDKIRRLFSSSKIPQNLLNLQKLRIIRCTEMVKVIENDEEEVLSSSSSSCDHPTKHTTTTLFPSLQEINLLGLPKLDSFCEWRCARLALPSLTNVYISHCDEMKSFNAGAGSLIITPALRTVAIDDEYLECGDDLNAALHQQFEKLKRERENS